MTTPEPIDGDDRDTIDPDDVVDPAEFPPAPEPAPADPEPGA